MRKSLTVIKDPQTWSSINWKQQEKRVSNLQRRIAKAAKSNDKQKVRSLQKLLTRSLSAKLLAVKKVTSNKGKRTSGVDKEIWSTDKSKIKATYSLNRRSYKPKPLKRIYIKKTNGKRRPLSIPTMKDRAMQTLFCMALDPVVEANADKNSFGFRKYRSAHDAMDMCRRILCHKTAATWVLEADIKGCFDRINHQWTLKNVCLEKNILNKWLKTKIIHKNQVKLAKQGISQGSPVSPVIANATLDGLEKLINSECNKRKGDNKNVHRVNLIRFADDFIITSNSKEYLEEIIVPLVIKFLKPRGLKLSKSKTRITHILDGFNFLGFNFRKNNKNKLTVKPSRENQKRLMDNLRYITKKAGMFQSDKLIVILNSRIRGWVNYFKSANSKKVFSKIDWELWYIVWKWAKHRHPGKGRRWIARKYFCTIGRNNWIFKGNKYKLINLAKTRIVRHVIINRDKNPYLDKEYYDNRKIIINGKAGSQDDLIYA